MRTHELDAATYWKHEFKALCSRERLKEFVVINIDNVDFDVTTSKAAARNKFRMVQLEVARKEDFGHNDTTFIVNTHLGELINYNDTVLAYDLNQITLQDLEDYDNKTNHMPDLVVVRKCFPKVRKAQKKRIWKLKNLNMEEKGENNIHARKSKKATQEEIGDRDMKIFMNDIEEDPELRANINLYKVSLSLL